jgi:hypothetical protein
VHFRFEGESGQDEQSLQPIPRVQSKGSSTLCADDLLDLQVIQRQSVTLPQAGSEMFLWGCAQKDYADLVEIVPVVSQ